MFSHKVSINNNIKVYVIWVYRDIEADDDPVADLGLVHGGHGSQLVCPEGLGPEDANDGPLLDGEGREPLRRSPKLLRRDEGRRRRDEGAEKEGGPHDHAQDLAAPRRSRSATILREVGASLEG